MHPSCLQVDKGNDSSESRQHHKTLLTMAATSLLSAAVTALALISPSSAFVPSPSNYVSIKSSLSMSNNDGEISTSTRRGFMDSLATTTAALAGASSIWLQPSPAMAYGLGKTNDKLAR